MLVISGDLDGALSIYMNMIDIAVEFGGNPINAAYKHIQAR